MALKIGDGIAITNLVMNCCIAGLAMRRLLSLWSVV